MLLLVSFKVFLFNWYWVGILLQILFPLLLFFLLLCVVTLLSLLFLFLSSLLLFGIASSLVATCTSSNLCHLNLAEKHQNLNGTTVAVLECSEGFYQENGSSVCSPSCYTLLQYNKALSIFLDVVAFTTAFIAFVAGAAVIIISCLLHKRM